MDFLEYITPFVSDFFNPKKRIFIGYLVLATLIAVGWMVFMRKASLPLALKRVFDPKIFWSNSAKADYQIFLINRVITLFISPMLLSQVAIATAIYFYLHAQSWIAPGAFGHISTPVIVALFTAVLFTVDDFSKFFLHRAMHRYPLLWSIHKVHHSATEMTPITVYRVHPLEGVLYTLRGVCVQGTVIPLFYFIFGNAVSLYTVVGINVFVFVFHVTGSNLRHSHIRIGYWRWLEHILISPAQHQLHHSIALRHFDKNFGAMLAIWDWMFRSLHVSKGETSLTFGLDDTQKSSPSNLRILYLQPFKDMYNVFRRRAQRVFSTKAFARSKARID